MVRVRPHIVIVGGGFAGLSCLHALANCQADVTLIDQNDHHLFQPLLYLAGTGGLDPEIVSTPLHRMVTRPRKTRLVQDRLAGVDRKARHVVLDGGETIPFDFLVLATGAHTNWFGHSEWADHAFDLKSKWDAERLSARLDHLPRDPRIAIVGAGPTGVELAGALADRQADRGDPAISANAEIMLVEAGREILPNYRRASRRAAAKALSKRGVRLCLRAGVEDIGPGGLQLAGERMGADLVIWAAGVAPVPLADMLGVEGAGPHGVPVTRQLTLADRGPAADRIFVVGDGADYGRFGEALPKLAPAAKDMGAFAGRVIAQQVRGLQPPRRFKFSSPGQMAVIAQGDAVAELGPLSVSGEAAWALWLTVHIAFLPGNDKRLKAFGRFARLPDTAQTIVAPHVPRLASPRLLLGAG